MGIELARNGLVGCTHDRLRFPLRQSFRRGIDQCRCLLNVAIGVIDALWHLVVADGEMDEAALRLRSPIAVGGYLDIAHRIGLAPHSGRIDADRDLTQDRISLLVHLITLALIPRELEPCNTTIAYGACVQLSHNPSTQVLVGCPSRSRGQGRPLASIPLRVSRAPSAGTITVHIP